MTETQIIDACKREDPFAQRLLYDRYVERLYLLCLRYIPSAVEAEEVLSDAFLKCFKNIGGFTFLGEGSTRAWLSKIVVNECLMFLRKHKQLIVPLEETIERAELSTEETVISQLNNRDLLARVRQLPTGYRTVLNLYVFENFTHREIANLLRITESTSKSQLFKARALLKQLINDS